MPDCTLEGRPISQGYYVRRRGEWLPLDEVRLSHTVGGHRDEARLLETILYIGKHGGCVLVHQGSKTDGGSKPWWSWAVVGHPWDEYLPCYVVHDAGCDEANTLLELGIVSNREARAMRRRADLRFLEGMRWLGEHALANATDWRARLKRRLQYRAVRCAALRMIRKRRKAIAMDVDISCPSAVQ